MGEFGDKFRQAREKKELSLDDVSNVTKISSRMLQAIEDEHFDQLPGGVFNKGFIRAYAKHLGLNSDDAVSDYLACLRQAQIDSHAGWDAETRTVRSAAPPVAEKSKSAQAPIAKEVLKPHPAEEVEELPELQLPRAADIRAGKKEYLGKPGPGTPWTLIAAVVVVVLAGIFFWIRHSRGAHSASTTITSPTVIASAAAPVAPATGVPAGPSSTVAPAQPQGAPPATAPAATPTSSTPDTANLQPAKSDDPDVTRAPKPASSASTPADPTQVKVERKGDVTIRSFGGSTLKTADDAAAKLTLVVRASENSWISVTSDGQLITQETLIAPAATSFHASRELVVRVGNAAGVSFLWNGDELPAQGAEAEAKTFTFDAQGIHAVTPPQTPTQN